MTQMARIPTIGNLRSQLLQLHARCLRLSVFLAAIVWAAADRSFAENRSEMDELRDRLEAVEKQNQMLTEQNQRLMQLWQELQGRIDNERENRNLSEEEGEKPAKDNVRKIVTDYLKKKDAEKKAEEAKQTESGATSWQVGQFSDLKARWENGLWYLESPEKAFRFHAGGRTQFDAVWMAAPDDVTFAPTGDVQDAVNFRRARLEVDGTIWETVDFYSQFDFLNTTDTDFRNSELNVINTPVPTDLWVTLTRIPWIGNLRVGNQKPPISLEHLTSSRYLDFLERSFAFDAWIGGLNNGFEPGIQAFNWFAGERATWAIGVFKNNGRIFGWNIGDGEYDITGRLTYLPYYYQEGRSLVHVGLGASHRDADDGQIRYRARTLLRNGPAALHTVMADLRADASGDTLLVPELIVQVGPFFIQSEFISVWAHGLRFPEGKPISDQVAKASVFYHGGYLQALYFLTGENRVYNRKYRENRRIATFDRVVPDENAFFVQGQDGHLLLGRGGWQIGARYSWINLDSDPISAGIVHDLTLGLNWFLNANTKIQWNYIVEHRDVPADAPNSQNATVHGFGTRLAIDF